MPKTWEVQMSAKAARQVKKLPAGVRSRLGYLLLAIETSGPVQPTMPHFGKLQGRGDLYHCHLKSGRPTYVAVWEIKDKSAVLVEVIYVGTHENAPY